jgi:hypothetical protein
MKKINEVATLSPNRDDVELSDPKNPLTAYGVHNEKPVYKYSYNPKTGRLLYSYPGENHADAIARVKDTKNFDDYVRIIYVPDSNVAGSRVWGAANYEEGDPEAGTKSFNAQHAAYKFFKKFNPKLKWVLNLTNSDLDKGVESLNLLKVGKNRILDSKQIEEMSKNFHNVKSLWENNLVYTMLEFYQGKI